ncbi:putative alkaline shock family protein YloU [Scopulibacillus daqui]|uniref:Alkaline shock family protein YloU n=1 Tax=Scopulibacillus daqui TaxID=1469162 RepID=A0ABS2Q208_9BACL|nr:Asp23/Gls24 family envelope stress response protein [Scopulibacillus daqui]MBM7646322.1 putative alkaline shock family protein YloU [Scopulibacillus daqui]
MEENKMFEMEETQSDLGKVEISPEVIEIIASLAATEVNGVAAMHGGFATGVAEKIGRRNYGKGVKVDLTDEGILIDVQLHMKYGVSIPEVGQQVQENILETLKTMTALDVKAINIHVIGVQFEHQDKKSIEE